MFWAKLITSTIPEEEFLVLQVMAESQYSNTSTNFHKIPLKQGHGTKQ